MNRGVNTTCWKAELEAFDEKKASELLNGEQVGHEN
jgi:hypothetical protein